MHFHAPIPILRIFDEERARDFYVGFLGFQVDWEARFGADSPVYMQVSRDGCTLQLSEHHGDACPGAAVHIQVTGLDELVAALNAKNYKYSRPHIQSTEWGSRESVIKDPFGNRMVFFEPLTEQ